MWFGIAETCMAVDMPHPEPGGEQVAEFFRKQFGGSAPVFRAPGRINIIGEHTDYNDGFVLPMAIHASTWVAVGRREDRLLQAYSEEFDEPVRLSLENLSGPPTKHWGDFVRGVAAVLQRNGLELPGVDLAVRSDVPIGAGLSSSASLEVSLALALASIAGPAVPPMDLAKLCQQAEHEYVGTRCGIMDQFVAVFGVAGHALLLDCRSLQKELIPLPLELRFVAVNTMVQHELSSGEYNLRRADCADGVKSLQLVLPHISALRDVRREDLERHKAVLPEKICRRCRHVITENDRVLAAANALRSNKLAELGKLMFESHASLRDDYEVSCRELDLLVELASSVPGVYGARMMGGGFGGCTINLVRPDAVDAFRYEVSHMYKKQTGIMAETYVCEPGQGASRWPAESNS